MNILSTVFLVLALVSGVLGFSELGGHPNANAQMLFFAFLIVFFASLIAARRNRFLR